MNFKNFFKRKKDDSKPKVRCVSYTSSQGDIIKSGVEAIRKVLFSDDQDARLSLIFCLRRYLDPWFGYNLPYEKEIFTMLEQLVVSEKNIDVADDALDVLESFDFGPYYPILEKQFDQINNNLKERAKLLIQQDAISQVETIMNDECKRIFDTNYHTPNPELRGSFPQKAIIVSDMSITPTAKQFPKDDCYSLFSLENDTIKCVGIPVTGIPYEKKPYDGDYYHKAEFYYGIDIDNMKVTLMCYFTKERACCQEYDISLQGETYTVKKH